MKKKTRNILLLILSLVVIIALALMDIDSHGKLSVGFLGMVILLAGTIIVPTAIELIKELKAKTKK